MRVLALETSTLAGGVALLRGRAAWSDRASSTSPSRIPSGSCPWSTDCSQDCRWTPRPGGRARRVHRPRLVHRAPGRRGHRQGAGPGARAARRRRCPRSTRSPRTCPSPTRRCARSSTPARARCTPALYRWTGRAMERRSDYLALPPEDVAAWLRRAGDRARRRGRGLPAVPRPAGRRGARRPRRAIACRRRRWSASSATRCSRRAGDQRRMRSRRSISGPPRRS